ncbi:YgfZ/GcvT domain-containing protein [Lysobacter korlensis]|uniref:YgfZ/GcvT domain-containing protein n=1 Tax=Lysobacter korlensis TaxID=553636 RepID=A0ABV6RV58_9GAMM
MTERRPEPVEGSPFSSRPGAVGSPVPLHYGSPLAEQRELAAGRAVVDLSHRAVLTVSGPDRLSWLDSLTSQALARLAPGASTETLQLDPHGHVEFAARVLDDGETAWLLTDDGEGLRRWLERMRFRLRVEIAERDAEFATIGSFAGADVPAAESNGVPLVWVDPWATPSGHAYAHPAEHPAAGWTYRETLVRREDLPALTATPAAGTLALEALRIAAWRPALPAEGDERLLPHEVDWLRTAVHLSKGCYRGQETVAKVHNLGHPPRRLVFLHLDGSDALLPEHGAAVLSGDDEVGRVTSAALHYELGPIALALVKRRLDPAAPLTVAADEERVAAAQEVIVPTDAGATVTVPRIPRLGSARR